MVISSHDRDISIIQCRRQHPQYNVVWTGGRVWPLNQSKILYGNCIAIRISTHELLHEARAIVIAPFAPVSDYLKGNCLA